MKLSELKIGQTARVETVGGEGALRHHFLDMGLIPGTVVTLVKLAPMGDPMELRIRGYELTMRVAEAEKIDVKAVEDSSKEQKEEKERKSASRPGRRRKIPPKRFRKSAPRRNNPQFCPGRKPEQRQNHTF